MQERLLHQLASRDAFELEKIDDNSYKVVFLHNFMKAYNAMAIWWQNYSEVMDIKEVSYQHNTENDESNVTVRLSKDGRGLWLVTDTERVFLNRFTTGRPPELVMGYLIINRPGSLVTLAELKRDLEGVASVDDIAELVRKIGFDKQLKNLFFKRCGKQEVELKNPIETSYAEWQEIKQKLATGKNRKKSEKL